MPCSGRSGLSALGLSCVSGTRSEPSNSGRPGPATPDIHIVLNPINDRAGVLVIPGRIHQFYHNNYPSTNTKHPPSLEVGDISIVANSHWISFEFCVLRGKVAGLGTPLAGLGKKDGCHGMRLSGLITTDN